jgi:1,4-alpha-glucan branching enzyme
MAKQAVTSRNQIFRFHAPNAGKVLLAGDFTDWQNQAMPMKKEKDGVWTATVGLSPGPHQYLFIVDGQWCDDPECPVRIPNSFGGQNMVRQVA